MSTTPEPVEEKSGRRDLDLVHSLAAALSVDAEPNTCFDNVLRLFTTPSLSTLFTSGRWVEGWYVVELEDEVVLNEHAWVEMPDGHIVDPTVVVLVPPQCPVYYFAGIYRSGDEIRALARQKDVFFPYVRSVGTYGKDWLGHPQYRAAHDVAVKKVRMLAHMSNPPQKETFLMAQDDIGDNIQIHIIVLDENSSHEKK